MRPYAGFSIAANLMFGKSKNSINLAPAAALDIPTTYFGVSKMDKSGVTALHQPVELALLWEKYMLSSFKGTCASGNIVFVMRPITSGAPVV